MITIFKYQLELTGTQQVRLPNTHRILTVGFQNNCICMWVEVDTNTPDLPEEIIILGTGQEKPEKANRYLGTVHDAKGFVWHLYKNQTDIN